MTELRDELRELCASVADLVQVTKRMNQDIADLQREPGYYMGEARRIDSELNELLDGRGSPYRRPGRKRLKRRPDDRWEEIARFMMRTVLSESL